MAFVWVDPPSSHIYYKHWLTCLGTDQVDVTGKGLVLIDDQMLNFSVVGEELL